MHRVVALSFVLLSLACGVERTGPEGPPGPAGPAGPPGPAGEDGADGAGVSQVFNCTGRSTFGSLALIFDYDRYVFEDGSVMATCEIADVSASYSNTALYKSSQAGASVGGCILSYDVDSPHTGGFWEFSTSTTAGAGATYRDVGSPANGVRVTFTCTAR
jgi:hypothetical protein